MFHFGKRHTARPFAIAAVCAAMAALPSCDHLYDDLPECDAGARLRFVYDYNMEWANAFPSQVHCLTVLVYDSLGSHVATRVETAAERLSDEAWRMAIDLAPGRYHIVAYGGLACDSASFAFVQTPAAAAPLADLRVTMTDPATAADLHPLFYGATDIDIPASALGYTDDTVRMMKDTNRLRILLQHVSGADVDDRDFDFTITDDNTLFAADNSLLPAPTVTYTPWSHGQASLGRDSLGQPLQKVAYAELSTSRFVLPTAADGRPGPRLNILRHADGDTVLSCSLTSYLMLLRSEHYKGMGAQEYLDRESRWNFIFFLDEHDNWISTHIYINDWEVRLNDAAW